MSNSCVPEQKVILCGEYGVGKSSLFRRFSTDTFCPTSDRKSTIGLDHTSKAYRFEGKGVKLQLWDTGGMERVASITSSYYKFADAAIIVFSLDSLESFNMMSQHLLDIVSYAENAKIYLCGNKLDLKTTQVSDADIAVFCEQCHTLISGTFKTSCKTGEGVEEMFTSVANQLSAINRSRHELEMLKHSVGGFGLTDDTSDETSRKCTC